jgi:hypothetical protein
VDTLLARAEELARRWAIALLASRPLDRMAEVPLAQLAREAPALVAQAICALESDAELERLSTGDAPSGRDAFAPARRLAALAGAREVGETVAAVEAFRRVLWEATLEASRPAQLEGPSPIAEAPTSRTLADLADRLACVCAGIVAQALATSVANERQAPDAGERRAPGGSERRAPGGGERQAPDAGEVGQAVLVDEHEHEHEPAHTPARAVSSEGAAGAAREHAERDRPLSWDESPPVPPRAPPGEIAIRDERREHGAAAWTRSIGRQLARFEHDGLPFATLLVELVDFERCDRDESPGGLALLAAAVEDALAGELRGASSSVTQERPGRYWAIETETDRAGARVLAQRLADAARAALHRRGRALDVAIGTAVCPEDAREAAALAAHADVGLYAARSAARAGRAADGPGAGDAADAPGREP